MEVAKQRPKLVYYIKQNKSKIVKIEQNDRIKQSSSSTHDFQIRIVQWTLKERGSKFLRSDQSQTEVNRDDIIINLIIIKI